MCVTVMERGPRGLRCWACAKNWFAQIRTLKQRQTQDHKKRLLQFSLSLPETTPLTLGQSGPFIKLQHMCCSLNNIVIF
jgi:sporulation-control protein spo0M